MITQHRCETCDTLREELRQMRAAFVVDPHEAPSEYQLSPSERATYSLLQKRLNKPVRDEQIYFITRNASGKSKTELNNYNGMIKVLIRNMRVKLAKHNGPKIVTVWGIGYMMVSEQ